MKERGEGGGGGKGYIIITYIINLKPPTDERADVPWFFDSVVGGFGSAFCFI